MADKLPILPTNINTFLFDLDDTLLDGKKAARAFSTSLIKTFSPLLKIENENILLDEILEENSKFFKSRERLFLKLYNELPWTVRPKLSDILKFWCDEYPRVSVPAEGLYETLEYLLEKNYKIALVTNGPSEFQRAKIKKLKLEDYFKTMIISDEVGLKKPDKAIFEVALSKLGSKKENAAFVGDNPNTDILGAKNAQLFSFWISGGLSWCEKDFAPDYSLNSVHELLYLLQKSQNLNSLTD